MARRYRTAAGVILLILAAFLAGFALGGHAGTRYTSHPCTFDGGGTIAAGDAARTSDGRIWHCDDGRLYPAR